MMELKWVYQMISPNRFNSGDISNHAMSIRTQDQTASSLVSEYASVLVMYCPAGEGTVTVNLDLVIMPIRRNTIDTRQCLLEPVDTGIVIHFNSTPSFTL